MCCSRVYDCKIPCNRSLMTLLLLYLGNFYNIFHFSADIRYTKLDKANLLGSYSVFCMIKVKQASCSTIYYIPLNAFLVVAYTLYDMRLYCRKLYERS